MQVTRRDFIRISTLSFCSLVVSTGVTGCGNNSNPVSTDFKHGVASGDPTNNSMIIWTRLTPSKDVNSLNLSYEASKFKDFSILAHAGDIKALKENDYTVKIDLQNLDDGTVYYYRFKADAKTSIVGKTKTIAKNPTQVKMAVFTCSNYPAGYFNAYKSASEIDDIDVAVHLGDYIYEYGMFNHDGVTPSYATENAVKIGRALPKDNDKEILTLSDYRKRYALYHTDEGLVSLSKSVPIITVWDDHEFANDSYKDGAENHQSYEGSFQKRKEAAMKAYFEWIPIRPFEKDNDEIIYRSFNFGDIVSLHMLDTRIIGRDKQLSYTNFYDTSGKFKITEFLTAYSDKTRRMIGSEQLAWLDKKVKASTATWQVLGQQVIMGKMFLPAELLTSIETIAGSTSAAAKKAALLKTKTLLAELIAIKNKGASATPIEKARIATKLPYNLDAWDGYNAERENVLKIFKDANKKLIVLSGDSHNSWANEIINDAKNKIGVEYAVTSVTSPGMEKYLSLTTETEAKEFEGVLTTLIDNLKYTNLNQRGYLVVTYTHTDAIADWRYVDNYASTTFNLDTTREKQLKVTSADPTTLVDANITIS